MKPWQTYALYTLAAAVCLGITALAHYYAFGLMLWLWEH